MVDQSTRLPILCRCNEIPDKTFNVLIPSVMVQTVDQNGPADGFHILFGKLTLETAVGKNINPAAPPTTEVKRLKLCVKGQMAIRAL